MLARCHDDITFYNTVTSVEDDNIIHCFAEPDMPEWVTDYDHSKTQVLPFTSLSGIFEP